MTVRASMKLLFLGGSYGYRYLLIEVIRNYESSYPACDPSY